MCTVIPTPTGIETLEKCMALMQDIHDALKHRLILQTLETEMHNIRTLESKNIEKGKLKSKSLKKQELKSKHWKRKVEIRTLEKEKCIWHVLGNCALCDLILSILYD
jgi:hypothetical protein